MKILSSVTYIARSKQNQKHQIFFKTFKAMKQNHFWSSTRTQSNNNHFYYVHTDYCNTFNGVCTDLNIYMHILSVIPNLCSFFQNLKIVTHLLTKQVHFHMCEKRSGVGVLLNIVTCSTDNQMITLLDLHRWNAGTSLRNQNWIFIVNFTTFLSIPLCNAQMTEYR